MKRTGSWRWSLGSGNSRKVAESQLGPRAALQHWLELHGGDLPAPSLAEIRQALELLPLPAIAAGSAPASQSGPDASQRPLDDPQLACPSEAQRLIPAQASDFLVAHVPTQRRLPPSCVHGIAQGLARLQRIATDAHFGATQQRLAVLLLLTAPRWLWPEPPKPAEGHRPANARPKLIQERLTLLRHGQWDTLLTFMHRPSGAPPPTYDGQPRQPGTLSDRDCRYLVQAAEQGRIHTAWRQLHSCGVASTSARTLDSLRIKWAPPPTATAPPSPKVPHTATHSRPHGSHPCSPLHPTDAKRVCT